MLLVILADDAFMFMVSWELMSVSSYFLVIFQHENAANRRAGFLYILMAEIGALFILLGYSVLAAHGGSFEFANMRTAELNLLWSSIAFILALIGFGMKAGLVPLHVWLPEAHPVAPAHISALMSGVMLKVAIYGFIRFTFDLLPAAHWGWGVGVLIVGSITALMGVLYALMQNDMKRLLAYSSIENIGIIFIGLGLALIFFGTGHHLLGVMGLIAALYHSLNHSIFKSLLFLGAGATIHATREHDMERMGGLLKRMPWTGFFVLIGCISIAALPPFNGFVSEWLTFQTALQAWTLENPILRLLIPTSAAMLALTGALAATTFVKMYGVAFLGLGRTRHARRANEAPRGMRTALAMLAALCLLLGILPTFVISALNQIPEQLFGQSLTQAAAHSWLWLTPLPEAKASYSAPLIFLGVIIAWWAASILLRRGNVREVKRCEVWDCGFSTPNHRMQYTSTAFAMPFRRIFGLLFHIDEKVSEDESGQPRHQLQIRDRIWDWLYAPIGRAVFLASRRIRYLQTGNVRAYLSWTLITLLVLLWIIS